MYIAKSVKESVHENHEHRNDLAKLFRTSEELNEPEESQISGSIPEFCCGQILRVGPGMFDFKDGFSVNHYLDGYAILSKFEISKKSVKFHKKYLISDSYTRALKANRPVLTEFGTPAYPEKGKNWISRFVSAIIPEMSDNDISNIFQLGNDYFVINDACYFRKIDSKSLDTGPKFDTGDLFGFNGWTAHPLQDANGDTYNIGFSVLTGFKFHLVKIPKSVGVCQNTKDAFKNASILCTIPSSYNNTGISYVHSFGMTSKYIIFIEQPYIACVKKIMVALIKGYSAKDWMEWKPSLGNRFHIIDKSTGQIVNHKTEYFSDPFFFLHFVNCYEYDDELVVDVIAMDNPGILDGMQLCKLRQGIVERCSQPACKRFLIPLNVKDCQEGCNAINSKNFKSKAICTGPNRFALVPEILTDYGCEMPALNKNYFGKPYFYFYVSGTIAKNAFSHSICKIDIQNGGKVTSWKGSEYLYPGEILFIPNPESESGEESDGVLISAISDVEEGHEDFLLFIDARNMREIGRASFKNPVPGCLHNIFIKD